MPVWDAYRRIPTYAAMAVAILVSAAISAVIAALGVFVADLLLEKFDPNADGPGLGVLIILIAVNIAFCAYIVVVSVLINLHHQASWRVPTLAFVLCAVFLRLMGPFDLQFAPFVLGSAAIVWLLSCWYLRRKEMATPAHVV